MVQKNVPERSRADRRRIDGYLAGDPRAVAEVDSWIQLEFRRSYPRLRDEHRDLGQEVHSKLLANLRAGRFEHRSNLRNYVTAIAHRTGIDLLRLLYKDRAFTETSHAEPASESDNPYRSIEALEESQLIFQVVQALPAACRELWRLVFVEKLSYDQVSRRISVPPGTVKSRMWHCRQKAVAAFQRLGRACRRELRHT